MPVIGNMALSGSGSGGQTIEAQGAAVLGTIAGYVVTDIDFEFTDLSDPAEWEAGIGNGYIKPMGNMEKSADIGEGSKKVAGVNTTLITDKGSYALEFTHWASHFLFANLEKIEGQYRVILVDKEGQFLAVENKEGKQQGALATISAGKITFNHDGSNPTAKIMSVSFSNYGEVSGMKIYAQETVTISDVYAMIPKDAELIISTPAPTATTIKFTLNELPSKKGVAGKTATYFEFLKPDGTAQIMTAVTGVGNLYTATGTAFVSGTIRIKRPNTDYKEVTPLVITIP